MKSPFRVLFFDPGIPIDLLTVQLDVYLIWIPNDTHCSVPPNDWIATQDNPSYVCWTPLSIVIKLGKPNSACFIIFIYWCSSACLILDQPHLNAFSYAYVYIYPMCLGQKWCQMVIPASWLGLAVLGTFFALFIHGSVIPELMEPKKEGLDVFGSMARLGHVFNFSKITGMNAYMYIYIYIN